MSQALHPHGLHPKSRGCVHSKRPRTESALRRSPDELSTPALDISTLALAKRGKTPLTALTREAVAARALAEVAALPHLGPVRDAPGLPRALSRTLNELRRAALRPQEIESAGPSGPDLAPLLRAYEKILDDWSLADEAENRVSPSGGFFETSDEHPAVGLVVFFSEVPQALSKYEADLLESDRADLTHDSQLREDPENLLRSSESEGRELFEGKDPEAPLCGPGSRAGRSIRGRAKRSR